MTPQLEVAIAAIQPLSPTERQQQLQIVIHSDPSSNPQSNLSTISYSMLKLLRLFINLRILPPTFGLKKA
jgi:hypothetical protein